MKHLSNVQNLSFLKLMITDEVLFFGFWVLYHPYNIFTWQKQSARGKEGEQG